MLDLRSVVMAWRELQATLSTEANFPPSLKRHRHLAAPSELLAQGSPMRSLQGKKAWQHYQQSRWLPIAQKINFSRAKTALPDSSSHHTGGAEWGLRTLRQACCQEIPGSAMCVQNFDDSRGLAIRITYRISLRSSSLWEPRHPLLKVVYICFQVGKASGERAQRPPVLIQILG